MAGAASFPVRSNTGRKIRTRVSRHMSVGNHSVVWDGRDDNGNPVSSGVYLSRLECGGKARVAKMILMK